MKTRRRQSLFPIFVGILLAVMLASVNCIPQNSTSQPPTAVPFPPTRQSSTISTETTSASSQSTTSLAETKPATRIPASRQIKILLDDFKPQPYSGDSVYFFNRLEGDRGEINNSKPIWETDKLQPRYPLEIPGVVFG